MPPTEADLKTAHECLGGPTRARDIQASAIARALAEQRESVWRSLAADATLLDETVHVAVAAAFKLETMYVRREVSPRAELDALIELLGTHEVDGVVWHGTPSKCKQARDAARRMYRAAHSATGDAEKGRG